MFRRTFWFTAGAAAGVWATTKAKRKLRQLAPESLAAQAAHKAVDTGHRLREFALDVRAGMAQREAQLSAALGLTTDPADPRVLPAARRPALAAPRCTEAEDAEALPGDDPRAGAADRQRTARPLRSAGRGASRSRSAARPRPYRDRTPGKEDP